VEKFVEEQKEIGKRRSSQNGKDVNGKKPAQAKASPNRKVNKAAPKTSSPKGKSAPKKKAAAKAKPSKPLSTKAKKKNSRSYTRVPNAREFL
jgi:hypothetical protein